MLVKERHAQVSEYVRSEAWKSTAVLLDPPLGPATEHQRRRSMTRLCSTGMSAEQHRVRNDGNTLGGITLLLSSCGQNLNLCSSCLPLLSAIDFTRVERTLAIFLSNGGKNADLYKSGSQQRLLPGQVNKEPNNVL